MNEIPPNKKVVSKRAAQVVLVAALITAASGYFMGMRQVTALAASSKAAKEQHANHAGPASAGEQWSEVPTAHSYSQMARLPKANSGWVNSLASFVETGSKESIPAPDLHGRVQRRAFDGAPPTIPHGIEQTSSTSCLACHGNGMVIRGKIASPISHPHYQNCTQCHVPQNPTIPVGSLKPLAENDFEGYVAEAPAPRAYTGAPPILPHTTLMRNDCMSCHGPKGSAPIRTTHPDRQNCLQCHGLNPTLEQRFPETP